MVEEHSYDQIERRCPKCRTSYPGLGARGLAPPLCIGAEGGNLNHSQRRSRGAGEEGYHAFLPMRVVTVGNYPFSSPKQISPFRTGEPRRNAAGGDGLMLQRAIQTETQAEASSGAGGPYVFMKATMEGGSSIRLLRYERQGDPLCKLAGGPDERDQVFP